MKKFLIAIFLITMNGANASAQPKDNSTTNPIFERTLYIGASAPKVWAALTDPKIVSQYYLAPLGKLELKQGGEIFYGTAENKVIFGKIEELETGRKLGHTFQFAHSPEDPPSHVVYSIVPMGEMSALHLRHDRFLTTNQTFRDISGGWDTILSSLKTLLETGRTLPWPKQQ